MTTELLPCHFCHGKNVTAIIPVIRSKSANGFSVACFCGARGPLKANEHDAIAAWNARPAPSADAVALAEKLAHRINNSTMLRLTTFEPTRPNGLDEGMLANTILQVLEAFQQQIWAEAITEAANQIDCGGPKNGKNCRGRDLLKDGSCVMECSSDCFHANANQIRSLTPLERKEG